MEPFPNSLTNFDCDYDFTSINNQGNNEKGLYFLILCVCVCVCVYVFRCCEMRPIPGSLPFCVYVLDSLHLLFFWLNCLDGENETVSGCRYTPFRVYVFSVSYRDGKSPRKPRKKKQKIKIILTSAHHICSFFFVSFFLISVRL